MTVWPGQPYPLGATYDGAGTNFSLFSEVADRVQLCLFDGAGVQACVDLPEATGYCWHGYVPQVSPGQRYGFRVYGPWDPQKGQRCNPAKLLLDPYAKTIEGQLRWSEAVFGYSLKAAVDVRSDIDSAPFVPRSIVHDPGFDWSDERRLQRPLHETVIYETHVKGFTALHPEIPAELRGTYLGMAHPIAVDHLKRLGVTAVELMPVQQFVHEQKLTERGLRNYWGYNPIGYFAPHNEYVAGHDSTLAPMQFKQMVKALHQAGIEVILDVVYNHTAEGGDLGPTLCFRGLDNSAYYRLVDSDRRLYVDYSGSGNSLNVRHPQVLQLIMDSLRYWVLEMHVDGFRFDLAATLARELHEVDRLSAFFDLIQQDPVVSRVKLIAEPWDLGEGGYQVGNFPPVWSEWNGKYRDCVRDFWRGWDPPVGEFARRFSGSADLYHDTGRLPFASVNFVTAHDGFTLRDLVTYDSKHNEVNGEHNRDGPDDNRAWNCGAEGDTPDVNVNELRARQRRNFLTTLLLSQGVPMLLGADELGRTQRGNNNAYCQDNETSWYPWPSIDKDLLEFCRRLVAFRESHPVLRRRRWFHRGAIHGAAGADIAWFTSDGQQILEECSGAVTARALTVLLSGKNIPNPNSMGEPVADDTFCILFNAHIETVVFTLPTPDWCKRWLQTLDTALGWLTEQDSCEASSKLQVRAHSLVVLRQAPASGLASQEPPLLSGA
jgi:glycogen operon protein